MKRNTKNKQEGHTYTPRTVTKLTRDQLNEVKAMVAETRELYPEWRLGQTYFNVLYEYSPELADWVRGTYIDPFYDDSKVPVFLDNILATEGDR